MARKDPEATRAYHRAYMRVYRVTHHEQELARDRAYKLRHKEEIRERSRTWKKPTQEKRSAYNRAYRVKYPEKARERSRKKDRKYPEKHRERVRRHRLRHPERLRAYRQSVAEKRRPYFRAHYLANRLYYLMRDHQRRTRKHGAKRNTLSDAQWLEILAAFDYRCAYCGDKAQELEPDHITPVVKGGDTHEHNIVPSCPTCNRTKFTGPPPVPVQPLLLTIAAPKRQRRTS